MTEEGGAEPAADFTRLTGVGPKSAEALRAGGIETMGQLASATIDEVVEALDRGGAPVPRSRILAQRWHHQAWAIWWEEEREPGGGEDVVAAVEPPDADPDSDAESDSEPAPDAADGGGWEEHASFIVSFDRRSGPDGDAWQTRVWDTKAMVELVQPGVSPGFCIDVILRRARLPLLT